MAPDPTISVVISTYNRADCLPGVLESLNQQDLENVQEIVLVNNNSTDDTEEVIKSWQTKSAIPIRYVLEKNQGLSYARNRGVQEAKGDIAAFIDDDALASPDWLSQIKKVYQKNPDAACVGGKVLLEWGDLKRPKWLTDYFVHSLSFFELGYEDIQKIINPNELMIGCNVSFRRQTFLEMNGFDPNLGRKGDSLEEGEEMDLQKRLLGQNKAIYYNPQAVVSHLVFPHQVTKQFYYQFYSGKAITTVRNFQRNHSASALRTLGHFAIRIPVWIARTVKNLLKPDLRFYSWLQVILNCKATQYCLKRYSQ